MNIIQNICDTLKNRLTVSSCVLVATSALSGAYGNKNAEQNESKVVQKEGKSASTRAAINEDRLLCRVNETKR
jgi:hypothetical protein